MGSSAESRPGRGTQVFHAYGTVITLQEVHEEDGELLAAAVDGKWIRLGVQTPEQREKEWGFNALLRRAKEQASKMYLLSWEGSNIPRGALINGREIGWTQNGIVTSSTSETLGYYERLIDYGGKNRTTQQMLVFVRPDLSNES